MRIPSMIMGCEEGNQATLSAPAVAPLRIGPAGD